jgi:hypothetical protein
VAVAGGAEAEALADQDEQDGERGSYCWMP